jgi:hypothetical protein
LPASTPEQELLTAALHCIAEHHRRSLLAQTIPQNRTLGDHSCLLRPFPVETSPSPHRNWAPSTGHGARDPIASKFASWGPICEIRGPVCKTVSFRYRVKMLNLRKFIENHRKIIKMQTQFCWFPCE